jgi:hypothetical protein
MLTSDGATVHESAEMMELAAQERREVDVVAFAKVTRPGLLVNRYRYRQGGSVAGRARYR